LAIFRTQNKQVSPSVPSCSVLAPADHQWLATAVRVTVRVAELTDAEAVASLLTEMGYPSTAEAAEGAIDRFTRGSASHLQVAGLGPEVVGLVATHLVPRMDDDAWSCRITDLVVSNAHRRLGIGSALLTAAESHALTHGARRLDLSSGDWRQEAHAFYTNAGFTSHSRGFTRRLGDPSAAGDDAAENVGE
jgi:GNAT superfamily N-acetyltransferase